MLWRVRAGARGGGMDASWRWRRIRVITDSWVMTAMSRSVPRRHQGHGTAGGIANEAVQLIAAMGGALGVGVQGKAVDMGTPRARACRAFPYGAKTRAHASYPLSSPLPTG